MAMFRRKKKGAAPPPTRDPALGPVKVRVAHVPTGPVKFSFTPLKNFIHEDEAGNVLGSYVKGQVYRVREGNDRLERLLRKWNTEGKTRTL